jgi:hypothetical protein
VAVPWGRFTIRGDQLTVDMGEEEVSRLPEYKGGR